MNPPPGGVLPPTRFGVGRIEVGGSDERAAWHWQGQYIKPDGTAWHTDSCETKAEALAEAEAAVARLPEWVAYAAWQAREAALADLVDAANALARAETALVKAQARLARSQRRSA